MRWYVPAPPCTLPATDPATLSWPADAGDVGAVDELEAAVSRVELQAKQAPLRLERMWGQQAEAFTYGALPLCRGLR